MSKMWTWEIKSSNYHYGTQLVCHSVVDLGENRPVTQTFLSIHINHRTGGLCAITFAKLFGNARHHALLLGWLMISTAVEN